MQLSLGQGTESSREHSTIHGTVVNAVTREPISRALVFSADNRYATLTDAEGAFEFTVPGGNGSISWLSARKPGFLNEQNERRPFEAAPGAEITIPLVPESIIKGRVALSTADAAIGINVQIFSKQVREGIGRWTPGLSKRADSNGEFRFAELQPGVYKLLTHEFMDNDPAATVPGSQLYGFPPVYYPSATDFDGASNIQLTAGQTFQADISLVSHPYYPIRIPLANAEENTGMSISVSPQGHRGPGYSLGYNAQRQSIEGSLPNGTYLVEASTFGAKATVGTTSIAVAGAPLEARPLVLTRAGSVILDVKEEFSDTTQNSPGSWSDGKRTFPFRGPRLYLDAGVEAADDLERQRGASIRPPTGPNDDSLVIENVLPGRYWLRLSSAHGYVASATMGGVDLLHEPLSVGAGSSSTVEIKMRDDGAELDGTVSGLSALPLPAQSMPAGGRLSSFASSRAWVYCIPLPDSPGQFQERMVSSEGSFSNPSIPPGTYRVIAFRNQQINLPYRDAEAMKAYDGKGQVVRLSPGQKTSVQLQLSSSNE